MRVGFTSVVFCLAVRLAKAIPTGAEVLDNLIAATEKLDGTLENWNGGPFTLFPLGLQSQSLIQQVNTATTVFQGLGMRTEAADADVLKSGQQGAASIQHILNTVIASRPKFEKVPLGIPIMFGVLKALQLPTNRMTATILQGASPSSGQQLQQLQDQIKQLFVNAMNAFDE